jgi:hypothetical protein
MNSTAITIVRWGARIAGTAVIVFFLFLAFGRCVSTFSDLHLTRSILPVKWLLTMGCYIIGWKWEQMAGITIVMLYMMHGVMEPEALLMPFWIVMALPGLMYILCSMEWDAVSQDGHL